MSYRSDHDAALNRVAALESELARLRKEKEKEDKAKGGVRRLRPERGGKLVGVVAVGAAAIACAVGLMWRFTASDEKVIVVSDDVVVPAPIEVLPGLPRLTGEACARQVEEWAVRDARAADPREAGRRTAGEIMSGPNACGGAAGAAGEQERNVSSLITVYYENDPVTADGYASAEQLWREYHRARARL